MLLRKRQTTVQYVYITKKCSIFVESLAYHNEKSREQVMQDEGAKNLTRKLTNHWHMRKKFGRRNSKTQIHQRKGQIPAESQDACDKYALGSCQLQINKTLQKNEFTQLILPSGADGTKTKQYLFKKCNVAFKTSEVSPTSNKPVKNKMRKRAEEKSSRVRRNYEPYFCCVFFLRRRLKQQHLKKKRKNR